MKEEDFKKFIEEARRSNVKGRFGLIVGTPDGGWRNPTFFEALFTRIKWMCVDLFGTAGIKNLPKKK